QIAKRPRLRGPLTCWNSPDLQAHLRGVAGEHPPASDVAGGVVHGDCRLTEAGGDQVQRLHALDLADVTGGVHAGDVRLLPGIDANIALDELKPSLLHRAEVGFEAEVEQHGINLDVRLVTGAVVEDRRPGDVIVAVHLFQLIPELDVDGGLHQLGDAAGVRAEAVAAVDERHG